MKQNYLSLLDLLELIDEPNRSSSKQLYSDYKELFETARGSQYKHQAWGGGYLGHITDVMNIASQLYSSLDKLRPLPFTLSDSLLILYVHDLEKPWKYTGQEEQVLKFDTYQEFILDKLHAYNFDLSDKHLNALTYIHGEGKDYTSHTRIQNELAAFVHCCDTISARIWYDHPKDTSW